MSQTHLTDTQLQEYLDGNLPPGDPSALHLKSCPACRAALADYKALCISLADEPEFALSDNFADAVMDRLEVTEPAAESTGFLPFKISENVWAAAAVLVIAAVGFYFVDVPGLFGNLLGWIKFPETGDSRLLTTLQGFFSGHGKIAMMILFTTVTFSVIGVVDRIITHSRDKKQHVSYLAL